MNKPFNVRLPVLFAASLCAGIVYSTVLAYFRLSGIYILLPTLIAFAACIPVAIIKGRVSKPFIVIFASFFFLIGAIYTFARYVTFTDPNAFEGVTVKVNATIEQVGVTESGNKYLILNGVSINGSKTDYKIAAYLTEGAGGNFGRGYAVEFYTKLTRQNFIEDGGVSYNAIRGVKYICTAGDGVNGVYRFNLFGEINGALKRTLYDNLDGETAAVCFALLTGNTDAVSAGTLSSFRRGGIAHIFAVSGLHIGIIYAALGFLCKKCRVNRYVSAAVRIAVITLYSGVCLFTASSVRALVTCSAAAIAGCFHRKTDGLNSLSLAAVVILLVNPLNLFSVGFALSFSAVAGIHLLGKNLNRALGFLPKKLAKALSAGWSAQFATLPVQLNSFGYISLSGFLLNIIFIPLISVLYVLLLVCTLVSAAVPAVAPALMSFSATPIQLLINLVVTCGFENSLISGEYNRWLYVPFALIISGASDKINFRALPRVSAICAGVILIISSAVKPSVGRGYVLAEFSSGYEGGAVKFKTETGTVLVVTENFRGGKDLGANAIVVLGGDYSLNTALSLGGCECIYLHAGTLALPPINGTEIVCADSFTACGIDFAFNGGMLTAKACGVEISIVYGGGYTAGQSGSPLELYCQKSEGAVLYVNGASYSLDICGKMSFNVSGEGFNRLQTVPAE